MGVRPAQLLIAGGAALAVFGLLLLPKAVVKKDEQAAAMADSAQASPGPPAAHSPSSTASIDSALASLKKEATAAPTSQQVPLLDSIARSYLQATRVDCAAVYFARSAALSQRTEAYTLAADAYADAAGLALTPENRQKYQLQAQQHYALAQQREPENLDLKAKMAMTYVESENPMQAVLTLRQVLDKDPNHPLATYNLGLLSMQSGQYDKAEQRFAKLTELSPENVLAWYQLGLARRQLGKKAEAASALARVKTLSTDPEVNATVDDLIKELNQ